MPEEQRAEAEAKEPMHNSLASFFSSLFYVEKQEQNDNKEKPHRPHNKSGKKDRRKCKRCVIRPRSKSSSSTNVMTASSLPEVVLPPNPSAFAVFDAVRRLCLQRGKLDGNNVIIGGEDDDLNHRYTDALESVDASLYSGELSSSTSSQEESLSRPLPRVVDTGLKMVFEIVEESEHLYPSVCLRALKSLQHVLQGLLPEEIAFEVSNKLWNDLFQTLLRLSSREKKLLPQPKSAEEHFTSSIRAFAKSSLLSLALARGDTGKILTSVTALLTGDNDDALVMPKIFVELQRSVISALLGAHSMPTLSTEGLTSSALLDSFLIGDLPQGSLRSATCDQGRLYLVIQDSLLKVGTGYNDTERSQVLLHRPHAVEESDQVRVLIIDQKLFVVTSDLCSEKQRKVVQGAVSKAESPRLILRLQQYDKDCLKPCSDCLEVVLQDGVHSCQTFSDASSLGVMSMDGDDDFRVNFYRLKEDIQVVNSHKEMSLKLTKLQTHYFGKHLKNKGNHAVSEHVSTMDEEVIDVASGKDFSLLVSAQGKLFFTGKSESVGLKSNCDGNQWNPLLVAKSPQLQQVSIGHEGDHALLLAEDGDVYFVGLNKRGEDGGVFKSRGAKTCRPKRFTKPTENLHIVQVACNNGSSALVSKEGVLYLFGKDNHHSNYMGIVSALKNHVVTRVAMGKAHVVAVTRRGDCFTFGMNNKAQCGRDFIASKSSNNAYDDDDDDENKGEASKPIAGKCVNHEWKYEKCRVCPMCLECTGYGTACVSSKLVEKRKAGDLCGCGAGEAGCSLCGICKRCANADDDKEDKSDSKKGDSKVGRTSVKEVVGALLEQEADYLNNEVANLQPLEALVGRDRAMQQQVESYRLMSHLNRIRSRRKGARRSSKEESSKSSLKSKPHKSSAPDPDVEKEMYNKHTSLAPAPVILPQGTRIVEVSCGQHHTLLLNSRGQVLAFGTNNHGQLGMGDLIPRGAPSLVETKDTIRAVACGSMHSVLLTQTLGEVITFGAHDKGQLGRFGPSEAMNSCSSLAQIHLWYAFPKKVDNIGSQFGRRCTWIKANGDRTFVKLDQRLLDEQSFDRCTITSDDKTLFVWPKSRENSFSCLLINRDSGKCSALEEGLDLSNKEVCFDPQFDVMWTLDKTSLKTSAYHAVMSALRNSKSNNAKPSPSMLRPELAVPMHSNSLVSSSLCGLNALGCIDTLATMSSIQPKETSNNSNSMATDTKESSESSTVNRFSSLGGGWGYAGHSVEAVRFMVDTDLIIEGYCLYGGRGQYVAKIKLFELVTTDNEALESDLELLAESEETQYQVEPRNKHAIYFNETANISANKWYLAWARISGPGSDCGAAGLPKVVTEEGVVFSFRNSRQSNNGTDVTNGQIPSIIYRINNESTSDKSASSRFNNGHSDTQEVPVLSSRFARTVNEESLVSLNKLLKWSWQKIVDSEDMVKKGTYVLMASLRLIVNFINRAYCFTKIDNSLDTLAMAEAVYETKTLFEGLLTDGRLRSNMHLMTTIQESFVTCFHIFFPTGPLKWSYLCRLLSEDKKPVLTAVLEALCLPLVPLRNTFPITYSPENESSRSKVFSPTLESSMMINTADSNFYPILCQHMSLRGHSEPLRSSSFTFREVLDRLLKLVCVPLKQRLKGKVCALQSFELEEKACLTVAAIIAELITPQTTSTTETTTAESSVIRSPSRFAQLKDNRFEWLSGSATPDAIAFTVDKDIVVHGCVVFSDRSRNADFELEVLEERQSSSKTAKTQWRVLARHRETFSKEDVKKDDKFNTEIRLKRGIKVVQGTKYALLLRNHCANAVPNGENGCSKVKGSDETTFVFSNCQLSLNGTNVIRGQIPSILYSLAKPKKQSSSQLTKVATDDYAKRAAVAMTNTVLKSLDNVLMVARETLDYEDTEDTTLSILNEAPFTRLLMPKMLAQISSLASVDAALAVHLFTLFQTILPSIAVFNKLRYHESIETNTEVARRHTTVAESAHPYRSEATVKHYRVLFNSNVKWICLEFDAKCRTCQPEDNLQILIPCQQSNKNDDHFKSKANLTVTKGIFEADSSANFQVFKRFSLDQWPKMATVLPGNELILAFETASLQDAKKDKLEHRFGFRCLVTGFEGYEPRANGLRHLELELAFAASTCLAALMHNDVIGNDNLDHSSNMDSSSSSSQISEASSSIQETFIMHSSILGRGLALERRPSIKDAFQSHLPFVKANRNTSFLNDFIEYNINRPGGKLAMWLQPESFVDVNKCGVVVHNDDVTAGFPNRVTVRTVDQYGRQVVSANLRVSMQAVPESRGSLGQPSTNDGLILDKQVFGGHEVPDLSKKYSVTMKDKFAYRSITMMKSFDNYSFEELRLASPINREHQYKAENLLVKMSREEPGLYEAIWSPSAAGTFELRVTIDNYTVGSHKSRKLVRVNSALVPDTSIRPISFENSPTPRKTTSDEVRSKFVLKQSAGLRIRAQPSLQSEQIGIVPVNGHVIVESDEIINNDGKWVRIGQESIKQYCSNNKHYEEAYCLQYNAHLNKTFLVSEISPTKAQHSSSSVFPSQSRSLTRSSKRSALKAAKQVTLPSSFVVTRCGPAGHNVRVKPSLNASVVGRLQLGERVRAVKVEEIDGELWLKLDSERCGRYTLESQMRRRNDLREEEINEMWTLAQSNVVFLESEIKQKQVLAQDQLSRASSSSSLQSINAPPTLETSPKMRTPSTLERVSLVQPVPQHDSESVSVALKPSLFDKLGLRRTRDQSNPSLSESPGVRRPLSSSPPTNRRSRNVVASPSKHLVSSERHRQRTSTVVVGQARLMSNNNNESPPRASSASPKRETNGAPMRSPSNKSGMKPRLEPRRRIEMALTPSVAESVRCVFAALLWHEKRLNPAQLASEHLMRNSASRKSDEKTQMDPNLASMLDLWSQVASYCAHAMAHQLILYHPANNKQQSNNASAGNNDAKRVRLSAESSVSKKMVATARTVTNAAVTSMSPQQEEAHRVMMRNARFLLDLSNDNNEDEGNKASFGGARSKVIHSASNVKKGKAMREGRKSDVMTESFISELAVVDPHPMTNSTFQCLPMLTSDFCDFDLTNFLENTSSNTTPFPSPTKDEPHRELDVLNSSVMGFVLQYHDLSALRVAMTKALRQSACRVFALQGFDWLLRAVSQPAALHDVLWLFGAALKSSKDEKTSIYETDAHNFLLPHPLSSVRMAGKNALLPLEQSLHAFLQSLANLMPHLPVNSSLQLAATKAASIRIVSDDVVFMLSSRLAAAVLLQASKTSTERNDDDKDDAVDAWREAEAELHVSSRSAMLHALSDGSSETFWESGEEDRFKAKWIAVRFSDKSINRCRAVAIFVDNVRGLNHRVTGIGFEAHDDNEDLTRLKASETVKSVDLDSNHVGWLTCFINARKKVIKIVLNGPADTVRIWQVKTLEANENHKAVSASSSVWQRRLASEQIITSCRLLLRQLLQRLLSPGNSNNMENESNFELMESQDRLERQTLSLCLRWLRRQSESMLSSWEQNENSESDEFVNELLSLLLDLTETNGHALLSKLITTTTLIEDLVTLLHVGSTVLQSKCVKLLDQLLPSLSPENFVELLDLLPLTDLSEKRPQLLDAFLALIAKTLQVQIRTQDKSKKIISVTSATAIPKINEQESNLWCLRGSINNRQLAESTVALLSSFISGAKGEEWKSASRKAISNNLANLTRIEQRDYSECIQNETLWLALASLCVLDQGQVAEMAANQDEGNKSKSEEIYCDNHDDNHTLAAINCLDCQLNLCTECDRVLHLRRDVRLHRRQVLQHEEESLRLDVHEGCGRAKLYWLTAMADARSLKAMLEFRYVGDIGVRKKKDRSEDKSKTDSTKMDEKLETYSKIEEEGCRFCGQPVNQLDFLQDENHVCSDEECVERSKLVCTKRLSCGHMCNGVLNETKCPPCLRPDCSHYKRARDEGLVRQDGDTMCVICFVEELKAAPVIQLECGHVFHFECCRRVLKTRWSGGPRITFGFMLCPLCKSSIRHEALSDLMKPLEALLEDVRRKALMRLEYDNLSASEQVLSKDGAFYNDPTGFAMSRYAYYLCFKCQKAYYGGLVECALEANDKDTFDETELVCGGCSDVSRAQMCSKHGSDYLEYKCRYCCSVAVFFCFGTTHFCKTCHDQHQMVASIPKAQLPQCPVAPGAKAMDAKGPCPLGLKHPPTGEEFALGCGICRNAHTF